MSIEQVLIAKTKDQVDEKNGYNIQKSDLPASISATNLKAGEECFIWFKPLSENNWQPLMKEDGTQRKLSLADGNYFSIDNPVLIAATKGQTDQDVGVSLSVK